MTDPLRDRCDYSWLPAITCAHCLGHELDPDVAAAWDH